MSLHGIQKILPFAIDAKRTPLDLAVQDAIAFNLVLKNKKSNENLVSFSRLSWPLIFVQGTVTTHIVFDDVGINNMDISILNAPRQATIGHILRNIDNRTYTEMLDLIKEVIQYSEAGKQIKAEDKEEKIEETTRLFIQGLVPPSINEGIAKLIPLAQEEDIKDYPLLESVLSVEKALELTQKYKDYLVLVKGNIERWQTLKNLIQGPFDEWLNELNAQIKDTEIRYKSTISKEEKAITEEDVRELLNVERDRLDQKELLRKKAILEKIGGSFLPIDQILEDLRLKTRWFIKTDVYKKQPIDTAIEKAKEHIEILDGSADIIKEKVVQIRKSLEDFIKQINEIHQNIEKEFKDKELELRTQLAQRNSRIQSVSEASESYIESLKEAKNHLEEKLEEINEIIKDKIKKIKENVNELEQWGIPDKDSDLAQPVIREFLTVYSALFEDDDDEERLVVFLPVQINQNGEINSICDGFKELEKTVFNTLDDDMKIRSNFEFTMEKMNLISDEKWNKSLQLGLKFLTDNNYLSKEEADKILSFKS